MNNLVKLKGVSKQYGKTKALDNVSLDIPEGRIVGLVGPNGAGKTTMLRALTGLIDYEGKISVMDVEPKIDRPQLMSKTGVIHDISVLPPWMTVKQVLEFQHDIDEKFDKEKCEEVLKTTEVTLGKKVKQLSKGMKTQLHLAIVLSTNTKLLILDEPTHGLDIIFRKRFYSSILEDYFNDTKSVLISTHQIEEVEHILTDVVFINHGKVILYKSIIDLNEKYILLTVDNVNVEKVRAENPLTESALLGKKVFLMERLNAEKVLEYGEISTPSVSDIFLSIMGGSQ
jgi:ABC-2 type transport system ATP-binding protein